MTGTDNSLEIYQNNKLIFHSRGKWLYPLIEVQNFLKENSYDPEQLILHDKIIGKAAAILIVHMGIKKVHAGILSELGEEIFTGASVDYTFEQKVPRIQCRTESLLETVRSKNEAIEIILKKIESNIQGKK